jgi:hypothetical protein
MLRRRDTPQIGGKEMMTEVDVGIVSLQVIDKEAEEFLAGQPVFYH